MSARGEAVRRTREDILDVAEARFAEAWYDDVTLAQLAKAAGVSQQTLANHFGSKLDLYVAAIRERSAPRITAVRERAETGDVASVVAVVMEHYEIGGDATARLVALADREPGLRAVVEGGVRAHRAWVASVLAPQLARRRGRRREELLTLLSTVLDVSTWRHLRREVGLDAADTERHVRLLVEALVG